MKNKSLIFILSIVILLLGTTLTMSWFIFSNSVTIENDEAIHIVAGSKLEIAINEQDSEWVTELSLSGYDSLSCLDVTSDGVTFLYPDALDTNDLPIPPFSIVGEDISGYYVKIEIKIRSTTAMDVYLSNQSRVSGIEDTSALNNGGSYTNQSIYGNFTCDAIAGAIRIAFLEHNEDDSNTLKYVWIPNDKYHLSYNPSGIASFSYNGIRESSYGYATNNALQDAIIQNSYTVSDYANYNVLVGSPQANAVNNHVGYNKPIVSFTEAGEKIIRMHIWFEGTDREADKALNQGRVKYLLSFVGITKTNASQEKIDYINGITFNTTDNKLYFGENIATNLVYTINGIDWMEYNANEITRNISEYTIYIRSKETSSELCSDLRALVIPAR